MIGYSEYALRTGFPDPYQSIHEDKEQDYSLENQSHSGRSFAALIEVKSHMRPPPTLQQAIVIPAGERDTCAASRNILISFRHL